MKGDPYAARLARAAKAAGEAGLAGLLVTPGPDLAYLAGHAPPPLERLTLLVVAPGRNPVLLVPLLERPEALAAPATPISPTELAALVEAGESVRLHEYGFRGTVGAVPVAGRPDAVFLEGRAARLVLEFKFSAWRRPFPSHRLQLLAYGYLLGQNGYDVSRLVCGVLMLPPRPDGGEAFSLPEADYASCAALAAALAVEVEARPAAARRGGVEVIAPEPVGGGALSLFPYDPVEAARRLAWAIGYWEGRRAPQLADNPNKCRRCAFLEARLCGGSFGARMIRDASSAP